MSSRVTKVPLYQLMPIVLYESAEIARLPMPLALARYFRQRKQDRKSQQANPECSPK